MGKLQTHFQTTKHQWFANRNCNFGRPCQLGVLPTDGVCEAAVVYEIDKGHFGDTVLDGLRAAGVYK